MTGDSIYSNYIKNLSAVDNNCTSRETSMFASLINNNNNNTSPTPVIHTTPSTSTPTLRNHSTTLKVLDSDISDSEEEKEEEDEDEEENIILSNGLQTARVVQGHVVDDDFVPESSGPESVISNDGSIPNDQTSYALGGPNFKCLGLNITLWEANGPKYPIN